MNQAKKSLLLPEQTVNTQSHDAAHQAGLMARALLVVALSLTLVGAMRWALNITNANARQISTNLTHIQTHYDQQAMQTLPGTPQTTVIAPKRPTVGPTLEPE